jgi:hypothetical protein
VTIAHLGACTLTAETAVRLSSDMGHVMRWLEYAAGLPDEDRRRLALRVGTALSEARRAARIVSHDGDLEDLKHHLALAAVWLMDAERLLSEASSYRSPPQGTADGSRGAG